MYTNILSSFLEHLDSYGWVSDVELKLAINYVLQTRIKTIFLFENDLCRLFQEKSTIVA